MGRSVDVNWKKYCNIPWEYEGREYPNLDCWGLIRYFYKEEFDIELPALVGVHSSSDLDGVDQLVEKSGISYNHPLVQTDNPRPGDVILFNILGHPIHVGIYVDSTRFLHTGQGATSSVVVSFRNWKKRVDSYYTQPEN